MEKLENLKDRIVILHERLEIAKDKNNQTIIQHINKTIVLVEEKITALETKE